MRTGGLFQWVVAVAFAAVFAAATALAEGVDPSSWSAGDDITIAAGDTVVVSESTPDLNSLTIYGTLVTSNWMTRVQAKTVTVKDGGVVTCAGPFWDRAVQRDSDSVVFPALPSNRVWIAASNALTVEQGGKIDVNGRGYGCTFVIGGSSYYQGFGPGGSSDHTMAASHGGATHAKAAYGDAAWPTAPGSSGGGRNEKTRRCDFSSGGGAIYLDCPTAIVTISGTLCADGENARFVSSGTMRDQSAGSGGSILVDVRRLITVGAVITANGGNDCAVSVSTLYVAGAAGGRIALHYDAASQQEGDIDATTKIWAGNDCYKKYKTHEEKKWTRPGTVWLPDETVLGTLLAGGDRFCGEPILGSGDGHVTIPSINLTQGFVVFGNALANVTVTGDVTLSGDDVRLCVGANTRVASGALNGYCLDSSGDPFTFTVGGDMTVSSGSRVEFHPAPTNGLGQTHGGLVEISGKLNVTGASGHETAFAADCHYRNGAGVRLHAESISFGEQTTMTSRGFVANGSTARGPGAGNGFFRTQSKTYTAIGAGHGGRGGWASGATDANLARYGLAYDDPLRPTLAGSSGANDAVVFTGGTPGGGIIHLVADSRLSLAGTLSANSSSGACGTSGSGGSILLEAMEFVPATTAKLEAKGGGHDYSGAGGGGCIALWLGAPGCGYGEVKAYSEVDPAVAFGAATVSVAPGAVTTVHTAHLRDPESGTVKAVQATPFGQNLTVRTLNDGSFGTTEPAYGTYTVNLGDPVQLTASDVVNPANVRSRCTGYTVETLQDGGEWSEPVVYSGSTCSFMMDDKIYRVTWLWTLEAKVMVNSSEHGSVTASAPPKDAGWYALGSSVTLTAEAEDGYGFAFWSGDVPHANTSDNPLVLAMDTGKTVTPNFQPSPPGGQAFVWSGAGEDGNWYNSANWSPQGLPLAGDRVSFPDTAQADAFSVVIDRNTSALASLVVPSNVTLVATNWMTKIVARTVTVKEGGKITCAGPFADRATAVVPEIQMSNRVWIVCTDLTVEAGGRIDVSERGYGDAISSWRGRGYGPGRGLLVESENFYGGAAHGGLGNYHVGINGVYDSVSDPVLPGSSGTLKEYSGHNEYARAGGGAIRIDATGVVTLNGALAANGRASGERVGAGSGGSVLVYANRIVSGGGVISAKGGSSNGGGGRVALHYDVTAQESATLDDLTIDVGSGSRTDSACPGTLWVSDVQLLKFINDGKVSAEIFVGAEERVTFDSLMISSAAVRFGGTLTNVTILGDMTLTGENSRFVFGAARYDDTHPSTYAAFSSAAGRPFVLEVGGNLTMGAGSRAEFHAAPTNGLGVAFGGYVHVGGVWTVASGARVNTRCDPSTGAAFSFAARDLVVETNATVSADASGFPGAYGGSQKFGIGPGRGYSDNYGKSADSCGAGYGGHGAPTNASGTYGRTYGDANRPMLAGSSGAPEDASHHGAAGGGFIRIAVSGRMTIGGTLTANGQDAVFVSNRAYGSAGSGGAILVDAHRLTLLPGACVSAVGGNNGNPSTSCSFGAGGGGRVAFWTGAPWTPGYRVRPDNILDPSVAIPAGVTITVSGGTTTSAEIKGGEGTIRFINCRRGMAIMIF